MPMFMDKTTAYARNGDLHLAYHVHGDGPRSLVFVPGFVSHHEKGLEFPAYRRFFDTLASFARVITFDRRGTGQSDRPAELGTIEDQVDDVLAVMDAADVERAALMGTSEGGPMSILFAATHPQRVEKLILFGTYARMLRAKDYPQGFPADGVRTVMGRIVHEWGAGSGIDFFAPSWASDERLRSSWASFEREAASPGAIRSVLDVTFGIDVRDVLSMIQVPALVMTRGGDRVTPPSQGRYLAEHISGARFIELPGADHIAYGEDHDELLAEVHAFLTGKRPAPEPDRKLATVLFTDIARSTDRAAALGDAAWRRLLEAHNDLVRAQLEQFRGIEIKSTGDGFLAMFDGPTRAVRCALAAADAVRSLELQLRAGVHTGECEVMGEDIGGIAVHIASRVAGLAHAGEVLVSRTVKDLSVGSGFMFDDRGNHALKGVPEEWQLYSVRE